MRSKSFRPSAILIRHPLSILAFLIPVLLILALFSRYGTAETLSEATVIRFHDGDTVTLKMDGRAYRTRLIGIDAPEMGQEPWGKMSRTYLRRVLQENNGRVLVETDVVKLDKYNRLLVYLWTPDRRDMINERMLRDGYAVLFTIQPNSRYAGRFVDAQRSAKKAGTGIWGPEGLKELPRDYKKTHPRM